MYESYPKSLTDTPNPEIKNFELIRPGDAIGMTASGELIHTHEEFYPVLFGEKNYTTIFGFKARKK